MRRKMLFVMGSCLAVLSILAGCGSHKIEPVSKDVTPETDLELQGEMFKVTLSSPAATPAGVRVCICVVRHNFVVENGRIIIEDGQRLPKAEDAVTPNILQCKEAPPLNIPSPWVLEFEGLDSGTAYDVINDTNCNGRYDEGVDILDLGAGNNGKFTTPRP